MKNYQNPQPQAVKRTEKKKEDNKEQKEKKIDKELKDTFPASDSTSKY